MLFTWTQILNGIFEAHRKGDLITEKFWQDMWEDSEIDFADTLDLIDA